MGLAHVRKEMRASGYQMIDLGAGFAWCKGDMSGVYVSISDANCDCGDGKPRDIEGDCNVYLMSGADCLDAERVSGVKAAANKGDEYLTSVAPAPTVKGEKI